jgi:hypothetical protein
MIRLIETGISEDCYTADDLFTDLENGIWGELKTGKPIDVYRRNLQKVYIDKITDFLKPAKATVVSIPAGTLYASTSRSVALEQTDMPSITRGHLESLQASIKKAIPLETDKMSKYHLKDILKRIDLALDPK